MSLDRFMAPLKAMSSVLFIGLFVIVPLSLSQSWPWPAARPALLACLLGLHLAIVALCAVIIKGCGIKSTAVVTRILPMCFFPWSTSHAAALIVRDPFVEFDTAVLSAELLGQRGFADLARRHLSRIAAGEALSRGTSRAEYWEECGRAWETLLSEHGCDPREAQSPPQRSDSTAVSYCPACFSEYREDARQCVECRLPLRPFVGRAD